MHNSSQRETQMSNGRMDKLIVVYSYNGTVFSNENERPMTTCNNMNESHK